MFRNIAKCNIWESPRAYSIPYKTLTDISGNYCSKLPL